MLDEPKDARQWPGLADWFESGPGGASAKSIVAHLTGQGEQHGDYPSDAGDFGRCEKLLEMVPSLRPELHRMAEVNAYWAALVEQWDHLRASPQPTRAIKAIIAPIQQADPGHIQLDAIASMRVGPNTFQGKPRMKETEADRAVSDAAYRVVADELRSFVERLERLDAEKKDIADQQKEVMSEAKSRGYDTKILRKVIALRKRDRDKIAEEEAILELYRTALGMH